MAQAKKDLFSRRLSSLSRYARAVSHPARIAILETLAKKRNCICGEISEILPLAQSTVSQHLKALKEAGLIRGKIEGPRSCYCLNPAALQEMEKLAAAFFRNIGK